jgi:hypothetical protein
MQKNVIASVALAASIVLAACGGGQTNEPTGHDRKVAKLYSSIDTANIKTEADVAAQYKVYYELKKKNKEVLQNEPMAAIEDLAYYAFFLGKKSALMNLESKTYEAMVATMDSLDKANEQK